MLKIGLTGGIGSGKSLICKVFKCLGVPVYSSDTEAKNLLDEDASVKDRLIKIFGEEMYDANGRLNRKMLADKVFNDANALEALNAVVHPAVRAHFLSWTEQHQEAPYIVKEAAILIESGAHKDVDEIVTVYAPEDIRIDRVMKRDHISKEAVVVRIKKQMNEEEKLKLADYVIYNDDQQLVLPQVVKLHNLFSKGVLTKA